MISFRNTTADTFQARLKNDAMTLHSSQKVFIPADKTSNYYQMERQTYRTLLENNITKDYKKTNKHTSTKINREAKLIASELQLDDRIDPIAPRQAYVSLKDHKDNFHNRPQCRLINPTKSELGKVSKIILERINRRLVLATQVRQWKNTQAVLKWFDQIVDKPNCTFINFDIVNFYPSISQDTLDESQNFACNFIEITPEERRIMKNTRQSLLFSDDAPWVKKSCDTLFDVTMGSYDGAEVCELVGIFLLNQLPKESSHRIGLYRDDGLAILKDHPREVENLKKKICKTFKDHGLDITIEANKKVINFLDVTLNLHNETYKPYTKPANTPLYIHTSSNHPASILENIPLAINRRLSLISSNEECFNLEARPYQQALEKSGYTHKLEYSKSAALQPEKRNRKRNITWFNPPFNKAVATNVGRKFLNIVKDTFKQDHPLRKIFNANTIKLSYCCTTNMHSMVTAENTRKLKTEYGEQGDQVAKKCNCRRKAECPMSGDCLSAGIIYQATVDVSGGKETYIGLTETTFKTRYANHKMSFNHEKHRHNTELSKYIWQLKERDKAYSITWRILARASPYNPATKRCNLCIAEKYFIIYKHTMGTLNKRDELTSTCRHAGKYSLRKFK